MPELIVRTATLLRLRRWAGVTMPVSAVVITLGMFLGWYRSGTRMRNSFEMMRVPQELGLDGFATIRLVWFLLPVVAGGVIGFSVLGRRRLAAGLLALQSLVAVVVAAVVAASSIDAGIGPAVTATAALAGLVAAVVAAVLR